MKKTIIFGCLISLVFFAASAFAQQYNAVPVTPLIQPSGTPTQTIPQQGVPQMPGQIQQQPQQQPMQQPLIPSLLRPQQKMTVPGVQPAAPEKGILPAAEAEQQLEPKPSEFEKYLSGGGLEMSDVISTDIRQFGYNLFEKAPSTFAPVEDVPVGPDYILGPGDEIKVTIWGRIEGSWTAGIERDGTVSIPRIGTLTVAGLSYKELKELLVKETSKYYSGFDMNVSLGTLRTIRVYMIGNAKNPGAYTVSSLSTLVSAIFTSGGPAKNGSMRDIQLKRGGRTLVHFDLYDLLIAGDKGKDVRLMPEDVIFIPPVGPLAAVAGYVNNPAIYELKGGEKIQDLLAMAGGLNSLAFWGRIQIERIVDGRRQVFIESDLEGLRAKDLAVETGDVVKVFPVYQDKRYVLISGAVHREGRYGFSPGITVKDLIQMAGGLRYHAFSKEAELTRVSITERGPETINIILSPEKALEGDPANNLALREDDYLFIRNVPEWQLYRLVTIQGEVKFPGTYTIMKGERISSLIQRAGGFTAKAYLKGAVFTRQSVREIQQQHLTDSIDRLEQQLLSTTAGGMQTSASAEEANQQKAAMAQQTTLLGKMRAAKPKGRLTIKLTDINTLKASPYDIELEEGDTLTIPENPSSVNVMGSVYNQMAFIHRPGTNVEDYIATAGGMTPDANDSEVFILKADGSAVSRQQGGSWAFGSGSFMSSVPDPGDTVVVPPDFEKISWMKELKDITQIFYQIAVTAGVLIVAF